MADHILLEDGDDLLQEDNASHILLESAPDVVEPAGVPRDLHYQAEQVLLGSFSLVTRCRLLAGGEVVRTLEAATWSRTEDYEAAIRTRADLEIGDEFAELLEDEDILSPFGSEVELSAGLLFPDGTEQLEPLAILRVDADEATAGTKTGIRISAMDRASVVERDPWQAITVAGGVTYGQAVRTLVRAQLPETIFDISDVGWLTYPMLVTENPWQAGLELATAAGLDLWFDEVGHCVMSPAPTIRNPVAWEFVEGENCTVTQSTRRRTAQDVPSGVTIEGTNSALPSPVMVTVWDDDPSSPTYYKGPHGRVLKRFSSEWVTSSGQAEDMARQVLQREAGKALTARIATVPNHLLHAGDLVLLDSPSVGVNGEHFLVGTVTFSADPAAETELDLTRALRPAGARI